MKRAARGSGLREAALRIKLSVVLEFTLLTPWSAWFDARRPGPLTAMALAFVGGLGVLDHITGFEYSFAVFYVLPVYFTAWYAGRSPALMVSLISAITWQTANRLAGESHSNELVTLWNTGTRLGFFVVVSLLASNLRDVLERERATSRLDPLTGLPNLRSFLGMATGAVRRCRQEQRPLSALYIDLDNFKQVNDTGGHAEGDALLREVASALIETVRLGDAIARLGGDEFTVLLPDTDEVPALALAERLREEMRTRAARKGWPVTLSVGLVVFKVAPERVEELVRAADALMYEAKKAGKDRVTKRIFE